MTEKKEEKMEVEETEADKEKKDKDKDKEATEDLAVIAFENLKEACGQLEKGESHYLARVMQGLSKTRKTLNVDNLHKLVSTQLSSLLPQRDALLDFLGAQRSSDIDHMMQVDSPKPASKSPRPARKGTGQQHSVVPEVEIYIHLLVLLYLMDNKKYQQADDCVRGLLQRIDQHDRRALDPMAAKAYYYLALIAERRGRLDEMRSYLNGRLRTATLRRELDSQAVLINCCLRSSLLSKQYRAAAMFISKVTFPDGANNNDYARYLYYQGRIKAMQLNYSAAAEFLLQAMRKAPQDTAIGFKQNVQKWTVVVSLLRGEIPDRSTFRTPIYRKPLMPYLELTQAVRLGDLVKFNETLERHGTVFERDGTMTLVVRLRQNVIKTALRQVSTAYSRISLEHVRQKLQLLHQDEAEYVIAKAIKDGAIEAVLMYDEEGRYMQSSEPADLYRTTEPQFAFHKRIEYCLGLHNQAVKALRYPPKSYANEVESIEEQREREQQELEFAKEMADEDDDDF